MLGGCRISGFEFIRFRVARFEGLGFALGFRV